MSDTDALSGAKFSSGLYLKEIPKEGVKIRVLTRDPMVYMDKYGNTKYVFAVFNIDARAVQILDKGPGFPQRFQEINADPDFGGDIRKIDLKITTNGKALKEIRYTITPVGVPGDLSADAIKVITTSGFDLAEKVKKNNPYALRLSQVNAGEKVRASDDEGEDDSEVAMQDIGGEPINLDDIPF